MPDSEANPSLDIDTLIERNPKVDREQLDEARKLVDQLERRGIRRPVYGIRSPYERKSPRRAERRSMP